MLFVPDSSAGSKQEAESGNDVENYVMMFRQFVASKTSSNTDKKMANWWLFIKKPQLPSGI